MDESRPVYRLGMDQPPGFATRNHVATPGFMAMDQVFPERKLWPPDSSSDGNRITINGHERPGSSPAARVNMSDAYLPVSGRGKRGGKRARRGLR